ncbi:acyl-CoA thioesterase [Agromyces seonyuensis]|uniref:Acyl-CoA thioesterase n=1 Tax=Agromyces seonyuensis TaxID=2662446 RepID=A0A6I4P026_9MICO|nr:thioesterase family protein [Agromyces seonyuensis]MWB97369.1 acyl-CoA thioesterase [Agromyces seonyuensis]
MKLTVPIQLRWSDLDAYAHVNNARMLGLLEEARISAFWQRDDESAPAGATTAVIDTSPTSATLTLIARQEVEYLAPIPYHRDPVEIELWIGRLGGASIEVCYEVFPPAGTEPRTCYTRAATTIVLVDRESGKPRKMTARERTAWEPYVEAPIVFKHSRG